MSVCTRRPHLMLIIGMACALSGIASQPAMAWTLDNANSRLSFVSVKAGNIGEVHHFNMLEGDVDNDGSARITVQLASIDTLIPIRDDRMKAMLFETDIFPTATIDITLDNAALEALAPGQMSAQKLSGVLQIKDRQLNFSTSVNAMRLSPDRLVVAALQPLVINAASLGLDAGLEQLREIAGLPSISQAVPVSFLLTFVQE
ncbi:MAG: YceI family protein [Pseudomonadota bacterium]